VKHFIQLLLCLLSGIFSIGYAGDEDSLKLHDWTSSAGKVIQAGFVSSTDEAVTVIMDGRAFVVPLNGLSPESRALAAKLNKRQKGRGRKTARKEKKEAPVSTTPLPALPEIGNAPKVSPNTVLRVSAGDVANAANWIDQYIGAGLAKVGRKPNPPAGDNVFVRRVYLDIAGRIPTSDEVVAFVESTNPGKRTALIDALIVSDGYRSHLFNWLGDMLRYKKGIKRFNYSHYERWLKDQVALNRPWDEMVTDMLTAEGSLASTGPAGYLLRDPGMPLDNLSNTLTIFLGANVACAQCHDHPMAEWTQREFYELSAFFGSTDVSDRDPRKVANKLKSNALTKQEVIVAVAQNMARVHTLPSQELNYPKDYAYDDVKPGSRVEPMLVSWKAGDEKGPAYAVDTTTPSGLRASFASWLTHDQNPRFAISIANRLWKRIFGIAVQEPVDDLDDLSLASNPELLEYLRGVMVFINFDLREFQRIIYNTKAYQATASVTPPMGDTGKYPFPGPVLRRMTAEQAWDSILTLVMGSELDNYKVDRSHSVTRFAFPFDDLSLNQVGQVTASMKASGYLNAGGNRLGELDYVDGKRPRKLGGEYLLRASELKQPAPEDHFLRMFGQSSRELVNDGSREGNIPQSLMLMNGEIQDLLIEKDSHLVRQFSKRRLKDGVVDSLYLSFFSRSPSASELEQVKEAMKGDMSQKDLVWVLFNSPEFLFVQ
jgi:hypothetical protein